ncbi:hypothetical protein [Brachybacterium phenoliresistens]|uniref:hypothetical protein n=1 Tax=Brachybacterium phenoliresistens TaxID=396014 RepID=UPI0031DD594E
MTVAPLLFFHDTSVLVNFHRPGLIPVLRPLLRGNVRWTGTIRTECIRQEAVLGLEGLVEAAEELLGEPLFPEPNEHVAIRQLRRQMSSPGDHPQQHLGEAEAITLIQKRRLRAVFVTDDRAAIRWADPIECVGTWKLIRSARRRDLVTRDEARGLWRSFMDAGGVPPRELCTEDAFVRSLDS